MRRERKARTPPVFLFGFERSGTTLLSLMVGAHPRIAVPFSVTGLWYRVGHSLERYNRLHSAGDVQRLVDDLLHQERIGLWDVELGREELLAGVQPGDYAAIVARFHECYAQHKSKDLWGNIDIDTLYHMDEANSWFPGARFVHIVRDVRDVALSHLTYAYGASNIGECADQWARSVHVNLKMGAVLGPDRYLVIRYEDLVLDPEDSLRRLCDFIGVPYSAQMLEYPRLAESVVPEDRRWLWPLLSQPPVRSNVYKWKTDMGRAQRAVCERLSHPLLTELGYAVSSPPPRAFGANLLELWYFLGRGHRFRRLAAKLGLAAGRAPGHQQPPSPPAGPAAGSSAP